MISRPLLVSLAALAAVGCATQAIPDPPVPYTAVDARLDGTTLQIRYLSPDGLLYSVSELPRVFATGREADGKFPVFVVTSSATAREPPTGPRSGRRVPVLGPAEFLRVRDAAVEAIVPRDANSAVVVEMHGESASLFYDLAGRFQSVIGEPPAGIEVVARVQLEDYLARVPAAVAGVLEEHGSGSREVLFNTGEADSNPWPFVYVNLDASAASFVLTRPLAAQRGPPAEPFLLLAAPVSHVVTSHTVGLLTRPVSSVSRAVVMLTDAARDTVDPAWFVGGETEPLPQLADGLGMDLTAWEAELDEITGRSASAGTVSPLVDGEAFFTRLERTLRDATDYVLLRMYIFDNDDYALRVADLLRERADDGVDVRVLIDGLGSTSAGTAPPAGLPDDHEPPVSIQAYLESDSPLRVRTILNPFGTSDHTKTVVVDGEVAFLGGMNIGREYRYEWHDMMVEVQGPVVAELADEFDAAWAGAGFLGDVGEFFERLAPGREPGPPTGYPVRLLYTRPTASEIRTVQLAAMRQAERYIYVQYAYLSDDTLLHELAQARRRGVDVRVVVPLGNDRGILARNSIVAANAMFRSGIRVYIYPGLSHVKAAIVDGWACVGSANANELSLRFNQETNIATSAPEAVRLLQDALFEADFRISSEMREELPTRWHDPLWELLGDYLF